MITLEELNKMYACAPLLAPPAGDELRRVIDEVRRLRTLGGALAKALGDALDRMTAIPSDTDGVVASEPGAQRAESALAAWREGVV